MNDSLNLLSIYHHLFSIYGPQGWWPAQTPWEMAIGAVLTQNTNWQNVERAIQQLRIRNLLDPLQLLQLPVEDLGTLIRPSGYFRIKAKRLHALCKWWIQHAQWAANPQTNLYDIRQSLLGVQGIGPETADSILLYAWNKPIFVVDTYTKRIFSRHRIIPNNWGYTEIQNFFISNLPTDVQLFNEYHALIVKVGKLHCKNRPLCNGCPLQHLLSNSI